MYGTLAGMVDTNGYLIRQFQVLVLPLPYMEAMFELSLCNVPRIMGASFSSVHTILSSNSFNITCICVWQLVWLLTLSSMSNAKLKMI